MKRVVFMGSPEMALPSLHALAGDKSVTLSGVIAQPDRPAGRKRRMQPCAVKATAQELGVPVSTPAKAGSEEGLASLRAFEPDMLVVCAYGQILPEALLTMPPLGSFNLHFSLLPRWRGASPVQAALLAGDAATGVSLQKMALALDAGPLVASTEPMAIQPDDTAESLGGRLAQASAQLLLRALPAVLAGNAALSPQDEDAVTFCRTIKKTQGAVDWTAENAVDIDRKCRAYTPWPGCFGYLGERRVAFTELRVLEESGAFGNPGVLTREGVIDAAVGRISLLRIKPEGKGPMALQDFVNGAPGVVGRQFTPGPVPPGGTRSR